MKIGEKEVINFLNFRKKVLLEELRKLDDTISVLNTSKSALYFSEDEVNHGDESKLNITFTPKFDVPHNYDNQSTLTNKIAYILNKLNEATKDEIMGYIISNEPKIDKKKLKANLSVRLSLLLKANKILGRKIGRNYIYSLLSNESK